MNKTLVIANWKMNPANMREALVLAQRVEQGVKSIGGVTVVLCPPFPYLAAISNKQSAIKLGAQDCFWEQKGAFTGEVSPAMLKDVGCSYVILGHSERRRYARESLPMIAKKIKAALVTSLTPVVCVGENVEKDLKSIVHKIENWKLGIGNLVLVYEPEWAISTRKNAKAATPEHCKKAVVRMQGLIKNETIPILYGGSVDAANVEAFMVQGGVQGVLVGGASLDAEKFVALVKNAKKA